MLETDSNEIFSTCSHILSTNVGDDSSFADSDEISILDTINAFCSCGETSSFLIISLAPSEATEFIVEFKSSFISFSFVSLDSEESSDLSNVSSKMKKKKKQ